MRARPTIALLPLVLLATLVSAPTASAATASGQKANFSTGFELFQRYCQSCHGSRGAGDGRVGRYLNVPPADLTQLSERNDGIFPEERLVKVIDGRNEVRTHGARQMPIWGEVFGEAAEGEDAQALVDERIAALIQVLRWFDGDSSAGAAPGD